MHDFVLSEKQKKLLPLLSYFKRSFGLVGGTAIALHIGHRKSIDFDLATTGEFDGQEIGETVRRDYEIQSVIVDKPTELTVVVDDIKVSFFKYPFGIAFEENFENVIHTPDLLTLASMKAYALGRRSRWKDYVDLYFLFKKFTFEEVSEKAIFFFGGEFNEKLFREQLYFFDDIDYSEKIEYTSGCEMTNNEIKKRLIEISFSKK